MDSQCIALKERAVILYVYLTQVKYHPLHNKHIKDLKAFRKAFFLLYTAKESIILTE